MPHDISRTIETPVLIVGGGPVGLALAADLGWRGAPCLVVEQGEGPADHPRATAINAARWSSCALGRGGRRAQRLGAGRLPAYCALLHDALGLRDRPHRSTAPRRPRRDHTSPERAQRCNQIWLDPILRDLAISFKSVTCAIAGGSRAHPDRRSCGRDRARSCARRAAPHRRSLCDRLQRRHSVIRRQLGMTMSGSSYLGHFSASSSRRRSCGSTTPWARRR